MPELPEVRTVSKHLNQRIKGLEILDVDIKLEKIIKEITPEDFKNKLINKRIVKVDNEGKWIIIHVEDDNNILVHLRLEGKFRTGDVEGIKTKHDHVIFHLSNNVKLYFNDTRQFGTFHLKGKNYLSEKPLSNLGQQLNGINIDEFYNKLSKKRIPIKSTMLDQTFVIGLGNIYINEALWWSKINPETPTNKISKSKLKTLIEYSYKIMEESYKQGGSSIATYSSLDGIKGTYQNELKVHGKNKEKCTKCNDAIIKIKVGGRGTYLCPTCQK